MDDYLNQIAQRADIIARQADDSWQATGSKPSKHTAELARLVVALAAHLRDMLKAPMNQPPEAQAIPTTDPERWYSKRPSSIDAGKDERKPHHDLQFCLNCEQPWCGYDYQGPSCKCPETEQRLYWYTADKSYVQDYYPDHMDDMSLPCDGTRPCAVCHRVPPYRGTRSV